MFNFWRRFPFIKPKKDGWYLCTCEHGNGLNKPRVMLLWYRVWDDKWINDSRLSVFNGYKVYKSSRAPIEDNRVWEDTDCERIDVMAWKKVPLKWRWWKESKDE